MVSVANLVKVPGNLGLQVYETSKQKAVSLMRRCVKAKVSLGVLRLDYHYPPAPGDVAHPGSYAYDVHYHMAGPFKSFQINILKNSNNNNNKYLLCLFVMFYLLHKSF